MRPIFHDYEYFEGAYYDIFRGFETLITKKLYVLSERKWKFKGWLTYPNCDEIEFELSYHDKDTEENYIIKGGCSVSDKFVLKEALVDFAVVEECSKKSFAFKMDIEDDKLLEKMEEAIGRVLENNRSYRYFKEDYERYMKSNPINYIKNLLCNHLLTMQEETFDEGYGVTYHYTGEFGEDSFEIVVDDCDYEDDEDIAAFDLINVNVCDRFHFSFSEPYSEKIRALLPFMKQIMIPVNDFLIRTSSMNCVNKEHHLHRIKALVCVDDGKNIKEVPVEAMFCEECNQYFISEIEYEILCRRGRVCSRVITLAEYKKITESGFNSWAEKSLLRSYGYTVSAQEGLSELERHRILSFVIENEIMKPGEVILFIDWLINRHSSKDNYNARQKWSRDIDYVRNYKPIEGMVKVRDIYRKKYIHR